jgi:hypothetical protein
MSAAPMGTPASAGTAIPASLPGNAASTPSLMTSGKPKDTATSAPVPASTATAAELPFVTIDVGYEYGDRWYRHTEPSTGEIRTYTALRLNTVAASAVVYPAQKSNIPVWKDVGITVAYAQSFGATSRLAGQTTEAGQASNNGSNTAQNVGPFTTTYQKWDIGARYRFPSAPVPGAWRFGAGIGYRQWRYDFDIPDEAGREVPRASYALARLSGDVEKWFGHIGLRGALALLPFLGNVTLGNRESESLSYGAEVSVGAAYSILPYLRVRGTLLYTLFHLPLKPLAGRNDEPGSVWDQYFSPSLTAEAVF